MGVEFLLWCDLAFFCWAHCQLDIELNSAIHISSVMIFIFYHPMRPYASP